MSVCPVWAHTFKSLDLESHFWYADLYIFEIFRSNSCIEVIR